ncbi:MAG: hypothetical protein IKB02_04800 [Clostridia bacterium]|nr:hypothetical protein [Clostridia bacterium]
MMRKSKLIITITSILLAALMLTGCKWGKKPSPDYPEPPEDSNAETFVETDEGKLDKNEGGGAVGLTYQTDVTVSIGSGSVGLFFANPSRSVDNLSIVLYVDGFRVAESGVIQPGNQITTLTLNEVGTRTIKDLGAREGKILVEFYNAETNEKAVVNTEIPVRVIVVN